MMHRGRRLLSFLSLIVLVAVVPQTSARADEVGWLADAETLPSVRATFGKAPDDCVDSRPDFILCGWELTSRDAAWSVAAKAIGTRRAVRIVCELPSDGSSREPESCRGWGEKRISLSDAFERGGSILGLDVGGKIGRDASPESRAASSRDLIDSARSIRAMSFLVGEPPHACLRRSAQHQLCH